MAVTEHSGLKIAYDEVGQGQPAVFFLPGWCAPRWVFQPLLPLMSRHRRILTIDWPGHGESDSSAGDFGLQALADDAAAVLDAARAKVEGTHPRPRPAGMVRAGRTSAVSRGAEGHASPDQWRQVVQAIFDHWLLGATNPELVRFVREGMGAFDFPMWARAAREISVAFDRDPVPLEALGRLNVPALHLYSQPQDEAYLNAQLDFSRVHPWFAVQRLQATSHFPMFEVPTEIVQAIVRFTEPLGS
jgi:pimeloyl-ACP methyl ester carboxylesterase